MNSVPYLRFLSVFYQNLQAAIILRGGLNCKIIQQVFPIGVPRHLHSLLPDKIQQPQIDALCVLEFTFPIDGGIEPCWFPGVAPPGRFQVVLSELCMKVTLNLFLAPSAARAA